MGKPEDDIRNAQFKNATGSAFSFEAIDGIGPKTANKLRRVRGVDAPKDVADYSAEELAQKAGISQGRAEKAIRGGGGTPTYSETSGPSGVGAGNIADNLDRQREQDAERVRAFGTDRADSGFAAAGTNVDRADGLSNTRKQRNSDIAGAPEEDLIRLGRLSDTFSTATAEPFEPGADPPIDVDDGRRDEAARARLAAEKGLFSKGYDRDEVDDLFGEDPTGDSFQSALLTAFFDGPSNFGEFDTDREEFGRAAQFQSERSADARRVDNARRAPVTDEITTWKSDPSHYDYPGIDTPEKGDDFFDTSNLP